MREVIREFDVTLSTKANKSAQELMVKELSLNFITHENWKELVVKFGKLKGVIESEMKNLDTKFEDFKTFNKNNMDERHEDLLKTKLKNYENVYREF